MTLLGHKSYQCVVSQRKQNPIHCKINVIYLTIKNKK